MRTKVATGALIAVAALIWVRSSDGQVSALPSPGTGSVPIKGTVEIINTPLVEATQVGDWKVAIANAPDVRVVNSPTVVESPLPFLATGSRYEVTWPVGEREVVRVAQLGGGGWVRVEGGARRRWVNLALVKAIEEIP